MEINGKQVEFKIEMGGKCNVITPYLFKRIAEMRRLVRQGSGVDCIWWDTLSTLGNVDFEVHMKSMSRNLEFHVIDKPVIQFHIVAIQGDLGNLLAFYASVNWNPGPPTPGT